MSKSLENVEKIIRYKSVAFLSYEEMCEIEKDLERLEKLEKVVNEFLEYLNKESNRKIPKHSIKQTFDKLLKEVFGDENS